MYTQLKSKKGVGALFFALLFFIAIPAFAETDTFSLTFQFINKTDRPVGCEPYNNRPFLLDPNETKTLHLNFQLNSGSQRCAGIASCELELPMELHWSPDAEKFRTEIRDPRRDLLFDLIDESPTARNEFIGLVESFHDCHFLD